MCKNCVPRLRRMCCILWCSPNCSFDCFTYARSIQDSGDTQKEMSGLQFTRSGATTTICATTHTCTIIKCKCSSIKYINHYRSTAPSWTSLFGFPQAKTVHTQSLPLPLSTHSLFLSLDCSAIPTSPSSIFPIWLFGDPNHHQMLPRNNKIGCRAPMHYNLPSFGKALPSTHP